MENNFNSNGNPGFTQQANQPYQQPYQPQYQQPYQQPNQPYQQPYKQPKKQSPLVQKQIKNFGIPLLAAATVLLSNFIYNIVDIINFCLDDELNRLTYIVFFFFFFMAPAIIGVIIGAVKKNTIAALSYVFGAIGGGGILHFIYFRLSNVTYFIFDNFFHYNVWRIASIVMLFIASIIGSLVAMFICKVLIDNNNSCYSPVVMRNSSILAAVAGIIISVCVILRDFAYRFDEIIYSCVLPIGIIILAVIISVVFGFIAKTNSSIRNSALVISAAFMVYQIYDAILYFVYGSSIFSRILYKIGYDSDFNLALFFRIICVIIGAAIGFVLVTIYCKEKMKQSDVNNKTEAVNS